MLRNITLVLLIYVFGVQSDDDLGTCFGGSDEICRSNRVSISGEYYRCQVLKRFQEAPTKLVYKNNNIYFKLNNTVYQYDYETTEIVNADVEIPKPFKKIKFDNKTVLGGSGKAIVTVAAGDDNDYMEVVTTGETTIDQIDNFKNKVFILSHRNVNGKRDDAGQLYVIDVNNLKRIDDSVLAEVIEDVNEKFTSLAVNLLKDELLLTGRDVLGGKLISISLLTSDPCKSDIVLKNKIETSPKIIGLDGEDKENFVKIVRDAEQNLTNLLEKFVDLSKDNNSDTSKFVELEAKIEYLNRELRKRESKVNLLLSRLYSESGRYGGGISGGGIGGGGISGGSVAFGGIGAGYSSPTYPEERPRTYPISRVNYGAPSNSFGYPDPIQPGNLMPNNFNPTPDWNNYPQINREPPDGCVRELSTCLDQSELFQKQLRFCREYNDELLKNKIDQRYFNNKK